MNSDENSENLSNVDLAYSHIVKKAKEQSNNIHNINDDQNNIKIYFIE